MSRTIFSQQYSFDQVDATADALLGHLPAYTHVVFHGDLGAGKTTMIKALCRKLGYGSDVTSPTFSLVNEYKISDECVVYHMDLYRLKSPKEALDFGFEEYLYDPIAYCFIEWPEIVLPLIPLPYFEIVIQHSGSEHRQLSLKKIDEVL